MPQPLPPAIKGEYDDDTDTEFIEETLPFLVTAISQTSQSTERIRSLLLPGRIYVSELLHTANPRRCWEVLRMRAETFFTLRDWLLAHTLLRSSRKKEGVSIEEKMVIFLYIVTRGASTRECSERFSHGASTIKTLVS
jgi:hypothetical protein